MVLGIVYALVYDYIYTTYICDIFSYHGSGHHISWTINHLLLYVALAATPLLLYRGLHTVASAFSFFVWFFAFIPLLNNLFTWGYPSVVWVSYSLTMYAFMCLFFATDNWCMLKRLFTAKHVKIKFQQIEWLIFFLYFVMLVSNANNMHMVNFLQDSETMYDLRAENSMGGNYLVAWMRSAFLPLLLVCYLRNHSYEKYAMVFIAYLSVYMIDYQKMTFLYPFLLTGLYFLASRGKRGFSEKFHIVLIAIFIIVPLLLISNLSNPTVYAIAAIFIMRTQCIEGMVGSTYFNFFCLHDHPYTYYNHINVVNALTHANPYPQSIGLAVTGGDGNANGTFWLMDGVAAWGIMGIIIISVLFILFKSMFNSIGKKYEITFCVPVLFFGIQAMINMSLFTALNSCGFILLYLIFLFVDLNNGTKSIRHK